MSNIGQPRGQNFYCRIIINGKEYSSSNIVDLTIKESIFNILPSYTLTIADDGFLIDTFMLEDNQEIAVLMAKNADSDEFLNMVFHVSDYMVGQISDNRKNVITIVGFIKTQDFFVCKSRGFEKSNSFQVLEKISSESGFEILNPRNTNPSDSMKWIQSNTSNFDFIGHVLKRSNVINDVAFFYGNCQNKFIYTGLNKEFNKENKRLARFSTAMFATDIKDLSDTDETIWFSSYDILNYSSYINKNIGYGATAKYYNLNVDVQVPYSNINKMAKYSFREKSRVGKSVLYKTFGDLNVRNYYDETYYVNMLKNKLIASTFLSFSIILNINALSKVNLFDKINLQLESSLTGYTNDVMSGDYLVGSIIHNVKANGIYRKLVSLNRNGFNKSINEKESLTSE